ncbi:DMT family transporter [Leucobacter soli]|uniref:Guanidinium exporter n=1 Tax=Leucobacter soli TaxID=2812850 RepID=A0A916K0F5_9MICO|nr:multidrug efflux SMR transporter [Leucobacter soli]CAG7617346.1 Guanidinium exporter [Leucobacter soli]
MLAWIVLIISGMFEAVWATALGKSEGFSKLWPSVVFVGGLIVSMAGLAFALREIPTGTGYAVWVGVGAALTVIYAMVTGDEPVSLLKTLLIIGLVGCIVGLKLVSDAEH